MTRHAITSILVGILAVGCAADIQATDPALQACETEEEALLTACTEFGEDSLECEDAAMSVRVVCTTDNKADGLKDRLNDVWINGGRECFEEQDLICLHTHFKKLVIAWRYVYRYPEAANAMDNFLECEADELTISREAFEEDLGMNPYFPEAISVGQLLEQTRAEARAQAAATTADRATFDLGAPLVVPKSQNVRYAIGRTTVTTTGNYVRLPDGTGQVTIHYSFRDRYDFHPNRMDDHSAEDGAYADTFPYHAWASLLVDTFHACEFDHVGAWEETIDVP